MNTEFANARRALDFLERHRIVPTATHYDFALAYITSPASDLARDIDALIDGGLRLTADAAAELVQRHLSRRSDAATGGRERAVRRQAEELGALTSDAHELTRSLESDVGAAVQRADSFPAGLDGLVTRLSGAERDLAELRAEFAKLRSDIGDVPRAADDGDRDTLTRALSQSGARAMLAQIAADERTFGLVMFSVDNLVGINRAYGTAVGDNVLNAFAATLRQTFPECDPIRWTGNEFVVVVKDRVLTAIRLSTEEALQSLAARRLKLRGTGEWIGVVTASAGIVMEPGVEMETLLDHARANALAAHAAGGNRAVS